MKPWDKLSVNPDGSAKKIKKVRIEKDVEGRTHIVETVEDAIEFPSMNRDIAFHLEGARELMRILDRSLKAFNRMKGKHIAFGAAERQDIVKSVRTARMIWTSWSNDLPSRGDKIQDEREEIVREGQQVKDLFDSMIDAFSAIQSSFNLAGYPVPVYIEIGTDEAIFIRTQLVKYINCLLPVDDCHPDDYHLDDELPCETYIDDVLPLIVNNWLSDSKVSESLPPPTLHDDPLINFYSGPPRPAGNPSVHGNLSGLIYEGNSEDS
jgi:hypothetical protein